jgi:hypothetical protein
LRQGGRNVGRRGVLKTMDVTALQVGKETKKYVLKETTEFIH